MFRATLGNLRMLNPGFDRSRVVELEVQPRPDGYRELDLSAYHQQLIDAVSLGAGGLSTAYSNLPVPAGNEGWLETVEDEALKSTAPATMFLVSPGFFRTLGIPLLAGRDFSWADDSYHVRVAIIDAKLAKQISRSAAAGAVGRRVRFSLQPEFESMQVVGVTNAARLIDIREPNAPVIFTPVSQHPDFTQGGSLFVRGWRSVSTKPLETIINSIGHEYVSRVASVSEAVDQGLLYEKAAALLATLFAAIAILVASLGLFGLMSSSVTGRTKEFGVRLALGAESADIYGLVLRQAVRITATGIIVGIPCAIAAGRVSAHLLFGVLPHSPVFLLISSGALLVIAVAAGSIPALRASKLTPSTILRHE
jgi:hypothetical protein